MAGLNFYSQLQRAVQKAPAKMDGMPAVQWSQWLDSNASKLAVKKEEIEWSGIKEYLALRGKDRLFRDDLVGYLRDNGVLVEEVELGRTASYTAWLSKKYAVPESEAEDLPEYDDDAVHAEFIAQTGRVKYESYAVQGGKNYREILITLPDSRDGALRGLAQTSREAAARILAEGGRGADVRARAQTAIASATLKDGGTFTSKHWATPNVLAHMRVDDRIDGDGKRVLFINEIQSDWGQQGKRAGFVGSKRAYGYAWDDSKMDWVNVPDQFAEAFGPENPDASRDAMYDSRSEAEAKLAAEGVVKGPFVANTEAWVGLALKRAIMMAVEGGYDRLAMITGDQAAGLYKLSNQVSSVTIGHMQDGSWGLSARTLNGGQPVEHKGLKSIADVGDLVGKDLADKAKDFQPGEYRQFQGVDLRIGGEGMVAFYDEIVPQVANGLLRRLGGGEVRKVQINGAAPAKAVDRLGFDESEIQVRNGTAGWFVERGKSFLRTGGPRYWDGAGWSHEEGATRLFPTKKAAIASVSATVQLGFDVTPAMREMVMAGVPLFSLAGGHDVLENPSSPDAVRAAIADLVGVGAEQLEAGVGRLVVTTSDQVGSLVQAARKAAFDSWFAGSKVMDADGKPLVMYRGSPNENAAPYSDRALIFVTAHAEFASTYGRSGAVYPLYVCAKRPFDASRGDGIELWRQFTQETGAPSWALARSDRGALPYWSVEPELSRWLDSKGVDYDGIWFAESNGTASLAVVSQSQIKSAIGNRGTYDPSDPNITHSLAAGELPDRAQAFHDRQSGATFFLADRIQLGKEASVFLHETVHRHGKARLPEGQFEALVGQVKAWAGDAQGSTERSIHDKAAGRVAAAGVSGPVADEELFAYAVEEAVAMGVQPSALAHEGSAEAWLSAVVQSIQRVADKLIGNSLAQLDGQDLVDLAYALAQVERPELGAVVEQALQEGAEGHSRHKVRPSFRVESRDGPSGQSNLTLRASLGDAPVGRIDYSVFRGVPAIEMIWVEEGHRRKGIGAAMVCELQREFPEQEIEWGLLTDDGAQLYESLPRQYIENPEFVALKQKLDKVVEQLAYYDRLGEAFHSQVSPTEGQRVEFLASVRDWNDLHDAQFDLSQALYEVKPGREMIVVGASAVVENARISEASTELAF